MNFKLNKRLSDLKHCFATGWKVCLIWFFEKIMVLDKVYAQKDSTVDLATLWIYITCEWIPLYKSRIFRRFVRFGTILFCENCRVNWYCNNKWYRSFVRVKHSWVLSVLSLQCLIQSRNWITVFFSLTKDFICTKSNKVLITKSFRLTVSLWLYGILHFYLGLSLRIIMHFYVRNAVSLFMI